MNVIELQKYFATHRYALRMGAGSIAKRTDSLKSDVIKARELVKTINSLPLKDNKKLPKILIFDIETAPIKAYVWKTWKENVSLDQIISDWFVICWSAKWLYSDEIMGDCVTPREARREDDKRVIKKLWDLFNEADIVIAHNAIKFDVPKMNARFLYYDMNPPAPYQIIDTLQVAKREFKFTSNKLDALAHYFGFAPKLDTDFELWKKCLEGDQEALDYMFEYNKYDVELLEAVYLKLRPWIHNHPNVGNYTDNNIPVCCNCGSYSLKPMDNQYYKTQISTYKLYRCRECGAISRNRININKDTRLISIAR